MPWVNHGRLNAKGREIEELEKEIERLSRKLTAQDREDPVPVAKILEPAASESIEQEKEPEPPTKLPTSPSPPPMPRALAADEATRKKTRPSIPIVAEPRADMQPSNADQTSGDWFGKLAVWVGGVALLMAGFYMVKYSIESGLLTPVVRLWLTTGFGTLLCLIGCTVSLKSASAGNLRIGQALSGAGVACLYFAVYAAVNLYGFISSGTGFTCMLAVTVLAVGLSLLHGAPIALMGLIGGFLTPMLMGNFHEETASLFIYLFLLFGAAQFLCVRRRWWALFLSSLVAAYLWSGILLIEYMRGITASLEGAMLFILGICALNMGLSLLLNNKEDDRRARSLLLVIRLLAWGGGLVQAIILLWLGGFEAVDMSLFSILSFGALTLAVLREDDFAWGGCLAFAAVLAGTLANPEAQLLRFMIWPSAVALVFFVVSHFKALRSESPVLWHGLALGSLISMVPALFANREWLFATSVPFEAFWLVLSAGAAGLILLAAEHLKRMVESNKTTVAVYSACAFFLTGFGLWDYTPTRYLSAVVAGLLLVAALYWKLRQLARAEQILGTFTVVWLISMLERIAIAGDYLLHFQIVSDDGFDWVSLATWYIGTVVLTLLWKWFGVNSNSAWRKCFSWMVGLITLLVIVSSYQLIDIKWMSERWDSLAIEGGLTSLLALLALLGLVLAMRSKTNLSACWLLSAIAGYRIVIVHLLDRGAQGDSFFWNALFWQFGIPFLAAFAMAWITRVRGFASSCRCYQIATMMLGFVWATFLVQDYFGGSRLLGPVTTNTEMYTYSVVWLLLAVVYQGMGLWRGAKTLHIGSLLLLILTVGKVFLIDTSALEGLYRVLSFLGLGVALIGIGFFYNKIIFGRESADEASPEPSA